VREEICDPLVIEDLWFGVPDEEVARVATLSTDMARPASDGMSSLTMPPAVAPCASVHNRRDVIQACIPGAGAIMSARAGARFFALLANAGELDGVRLLQEGTVHAMTQPRTNRPRSTRRSPVEALPPHRSALAAIGSPTRSQVQVPESRAESEPPPA
jgi:CubicO group peptidase (beta-lactamase class C family)